MLRKFSPGGWEANWKRRHEVGRFRNYGLMDDYIYFEVSSGDPSRRYISTTLEAFLPP